METTKFIKMIKACGEDRKKLFLSDNWEFKEAFYLVSESELDKIEKVNVELLSICEKAMKSEIDGSYVVASNWWVEMKQAIQNATNIKQI